MLTLVRQETFKPSEKPDNLEGTQDTASKDQGSEKLISEEIFYKVIE